MEPNVSRRFPDRRKMSSCASFSQLAEDCIPSRLNANLSFIMVRLASCTGTVHVTPGAAPPSTCSTWPRASCRCPRQPPTTPRWQRTGQLKLGKEKERDACSSIQGYDDSFRAGIPSEPEMVAGVGQNEKCMKPVEPDANAFITFSGGDCSRREDIFGSLPDEEIGFAFCATHHLWLNLASCQLSRNSVTSQQRLYLRTNSSFLVAERDLSAWSVWNNGKEKKAYLGDIIY